MDDTTFFSFNAWRRVDLVVASAQRLLPIEVKSERKFQPKHLKGLKAFMDKEKEEMCVLIGRFNQAEVIEEGKRRFFLLPYWMI